MWIPGNVLRVRGDSRKHTIVDRIVPRSGDIRLNLSAQALYGVGAVLVSRACFFWIGTVEGYAILGAILSIVGGDNGGMTVSFGERLEDTFKLAHIVFLERVDKDRTAAHGVELSQARGLG